MDTGRTEGGAHTETVDLREVAESVLKRAAGDALSKGVDVQTHARLRTRSTHTSSLSAAVG